MQAIIDLEGMGFTFSVADGKLKYTFIGAGQPDVSAAFLLSEVKSRKDEALAFILARQKQEQVEAREVIIQAFKGELKRATLIPVLPKYRSLLGNAVWVCPNEQYKREIKEKYKENLCCTVSDLWHIFRLIDEQGQLARSVIECYRLFGGELLLADDALPKEMDDIGKEISPTDSHLWVKLFGMARAIDVDFAARLMYLRGTGCRLEPDARTGYRITPIIDETGMAGWTSLEQYEAEKVCLWPFRQQLVELLRKL